MNDAVIDTPGEVRDGEALDAAAVTAWLQEQGVAVEGLPEVGQYSGGASNWTYRLRFANHDLILRRAPAGTKARGAHDMGREFRLQRALKPVFDAVPTMVAFCDDPSVIGVDFYVMERLEGIIPRRKFPPGVELSAEQTRALCTHFIDRLLELHAVDPAAAGLADFGRGEGYVHRQIEGWSKRYTAAKTVNVPSYRRVRDWLARHAPGETRLCIIHNDWRFDNLVLDPADPTRILGILDWELAALGDPLMELGSMLAYWVEADDSRLMRMTQRQPTTLAGMMTRDEVVRYYLDRSGLETKVWAFYEVYGLFRLAGIAQQIYYRYFTKQTRNPAFKNFWILIHYFDWRCRRIMRESGLR